MTKTAFKRGDWIIYRKTKYSAHPGPRALNVAPTPKGDNYVYNVDKFWIVVEALPDETIRAVTRRQKEVTCKISDPNLRRANWFERLWHRQRFEEIAASLQSGVPSPAQT